MTDTAPSIIVDRMAELIAEVPGIGLVRKFPLRDRSDIRNLIVSSIDGQDTLRAWWIEGPNLEASWLVQMGQAPWITRNWTWEIHGVEGLTPAWPGDPRLTGGDIETIRDNATLVMDALDGGDDLDLGLGYTAHPGDIVFSSSPCQIRQRPTQTTFLEGKLPLAYVVIEKRIETKPART